MISSQWRRLLFGALVPLLLLAVGAFAQSGYSFGVTSISPNPFNPSKGETATITYTVPTTSNYTIAVYNSAGSVVRTLVNYVGMPVGTKTRVWDGKSSTGVVAPDGTYSVRITGKTSAGTTIATGSGTVAVKSTTTTTPPPVTPPTSSTGYVVTGIAPNPFNPSKGETATITYTVPTLSNLSIAVYNSSGTQVRYLVNYVGMPAGTRTRVWDGKDRNGAVVPNGTYTVRIEGKTSAGVIIATGTGTVAVQSSTTTTPPPVVDPPPTTGPGTTPTASGELGQPVEGCGRANYDWFKNKGYKFDVAFRAPKSGTITQVSVPWRTTTPGYGSGNFGTFTWELQSNGAGNMPSGTVLAKTTGLRASTQTGGNGDAPFYAPITATVTAGQIYHFVIYNTDPNPGTNWSSINTVMTRVVSWDPANTPDARGASFNGSTWTPWSSNYDVWSSGGGNTKNGSHMALLVKWSDGSLTGDPYWSAAMGEPVNISGSQRGGQQIVWNRASVTIKRVGVSVKGSGTLKYHLEQVGKGELASGTFSNTSIGSVPQWVYATLSAPVTLQQGQTYRLWFEATSGSFSQNPVYAPGSGEWYNATWGGPQSCVIVGSGGSWSTKPTQDLAFSLQ